MYKPPKVTVVQFQIESGFAGSGDGLVNFFHDPGMDNTTAYTATSNSGDGFWETLISLDGRIINHI